MSVSENGLNSLLVTWTPSQGHDVTGYTIYYQQQDGGPSGSVEAGQHDTSITIPGLIVGATYSISIVAKSSTLHSTVTTGPSVTIGTSIKNLLNEGEWKNKWNKRLHTPSLYLCTTVTGQ